MEDAGPRTRWPGLMSLTTPAAMHSASDRPAQRQLHHQLQLQSQSQPQQQQQQTMQHPSRLTPTSCRVEKMTPSRLPLSRHSSQRSSSSLSTRHISAAAVRPLSWHSDPRLLQQHPKMAYTPEQQARRMMQFQQYLHRYYPSHQNHVSPYQQQHALEYSMPTSTYSHPQAEVQTLQQRTSPYYQQQQQQLQYQHEAAWGTHHTVTHRSGAAPSYLNSDLNHIRHPSQTHPGLPRADAEPISQPVSSLKQLDSSEEPVDDVLVGLGLYDRDPASNMSLGLMHATSPTATNTTIVSLGKGLKLEESWQPSAEDDASSSSPPASSPVPELDSSPVEDPYTSFETEHDDYYEDAVPSYHATTFNHDQPSFSQHSGHVYNSYYGPQPGTMHPPPLMMPPAHSDALYSDYYNADDANTTFKSSSSIPPTTTIVSHGMAPHVTAPNTMMWHSAVPQWNM